jgi:hypothetical protein
MRFIAASSIWCGDVANLACKEPDTSFLFHRQHGAFGFEDNILSSWTHRFVSRT